MSDLEIDIMEMLEKGTRHRPRLQELLINRR
jgi:hypothetical protein